MNNKKLLALAFFIGIIMYTIGFIWFMTFGKFVMIFGGAIISICIYTFGNNRRRNKKTLGVLLMIFAILLLISVVINLIVALAIMN